MKTPLFSGFLRPGLLPLACCLAAGSVLAGAGLAGCGNNVLGGSSAPSSGSAPSVVSNGPQLGYLWNPADQSLRPILGVPGAAQVGQTVTPAGLYVAGAGSARSSVAVLEQPGGSVSTLQLPLGSTLPLVGITAPAGAQILFSPSGQNAILFVPGGTTVTLLTSLASIPQAQVLTAPASLLAAAVSDTAQVAAVFGTGPLSLALLTGGNTSLTSLSAFGGLSFLPGGSDLLTADASTGSVTLIRNSATAPAPQTFTSSSIQSPVAVAASLDGRYAVVANGGDPSVVRLDLTGGTAPIRIACTCQPSLLSGLAGNAVFQLTTPGAGPTWLVDASAAKPQALFIPALVKP